MTYETPRRFDAVAFADDALGLLDGRTAVEKRVDDHPARSTLSLGFYERHPVG